jgi:hypothetical protein
MLSLSNLAIPSSIAVELSRESRDRLAAFIHQKTHLRWQGQVPLLKSLYLTLGVAPGLNLVHAISHRLRIAGCKGEAGAEYTRIPEQMVERVQENDC